jgi:hypothetical protein
MECSGVVRQAQKFLAGMDTAALFSTAVFDVPYVKRVGDSKPCRKSAMLSHAHFEDK